MERGEGVEVVYNKEMELTKEQRIKKYLPDGVYGAIDGTVTTFAIIGGVFGAGLSPLIVLILGFSNVLADGFSMAASNFLAKRSEESDENYHTAIYSAIITFVAFVLAGTVPLIPFVIALFTDLSITSQFVYSILGTTIAFIFTGYMRAKITQRNIFKSSVETLFVGGFAAAIAYTVGVALKGLGI